MGDTSIDTVLAYLEGEDLKAITYDLRTLKDEVLGKGELITTSQAERCVEAVQNAVRVTSEAVQHRLATRPTALPNEGDD